MDQPPNDEPPAELGMPGVESVSIGPDGKKVVVFNPIQTRIQWPGVSVTSKNFDSLGSSAKLYEQAIAFLNAAKILCEDAGNNAVAGEELVWSQGSVCYYCTHIATELFLKACISQKSGQVPKTHDLQMLLSSYAETLPQAEFQFQVPLAWQQLPSSFENMLDRAPDQLYRYGIGNDGKCSAYTHQFSPDTVFNRVVHLEQIWPRAWSSLCHRDG